VEEEGSRRATPGEIAFALLRLALLALCAVMLVYALRIYFAGIYPRLPEGTFRWMFPGAFFLALLGVLWALIRQCRSLWRLCGR
jgi:hypothetical protein